jgi:hypothetical protein
MIGNLQHEGKLSCSAPSVHFAQYVSSPIASILGIHECRNHKVKTCVFEGGREGTFEAPEAGLLVAGDESEARNGPYFRVYVSFFQAGLRCGRVLTAVQRTTCSESNRRGSP